jgi:hypothetical protein
MIDGRYRQLRAVLRNGLTWGAAWAVAGGALLGTFALFAPGPGVESLIERLGVALLAGVGWGLRFGIIGAVIGTVFASVIRLRYRGRRLAEIDPVRFAALGAGVGAVSVPLFLQLMNVLSSGRMISWALVLDDAPIAAVLGASAAAASIFLARRAEARARGTEADRLSDFADLDALPAAELPETLVSQRSRSAQY